MQGILICKSCPTTANFAFGGAFDNLSLDAFQAWKPFMSPHFLHELVTVFSDHAGRPALKHRGRRYSYGELDVQVRRGAATLQGRGVEKGDRVVLFTGEKLPFLVAFLGT